jgi:hypothetical protein
LRALSRHCPSWVPWAWATNSFMTVLGPLVCILLSMQAGFQAMFFLAALVYLAGYLVVRPQLSAAVADRRVVATTCVAPEYAALASHAVGDNRNAISPVGSASQLR